MELKNLFPLPKIVKEGTKIHLLKAIKLWDRKKSEILEKTVRKISKENSLSFYYSSNFEKANLRIIIENNIEKLNRLEEKEESYFLKIKKDSIEIKTFTEKGAFYGLQTLRQILNISKNKLREIEIIDWPDLKFRGVHLTLGSGHMPKFEQMKSLIERFALYKINNFVIEYDDRFPWEKHPIISHPDAYSKKQIKELISIAKENFIEIIPLLDSLGHAQQYLKHKEYAYLRELPDKIDEMCPSNPKTLKFMKELWEEVLEVHKDSKYAHITGDEVFRLGNFCPKCRKYAKRGQLHILFTRYYKKLSRWIIKKGKIPMMWGDMLIKYPKTIDIFPKDIVINDWCYYGIDKPYWDFIFCYGYFPKEDIKNIEKTKREMFEPYWFEKKGSSRCIPFPFYRLFKDKGFQVIGATNANGGIQFPNPRERFANNKRFAMTVKKNKGLGILITYWSSFAPIESAWYGILAGADFSWNSRNEKEKEFSRRFVRNFLSLPEKYGSVFSNLSDQLQTYPLGYQNYTSNSLKEIKDTFMKTKRMKEKGEKNNIYLDIWNEIAYLNYVGKETERIFLQIKNIVVGKGKDFPIDISKNTNKTFKDFPLPEDPHFLSLQPGNHKIYGVNFRIIDSERNRMKSLVILKGDEKTRIVLNRNFEKLYFLWTAYELHRGDKLGNLKVKFKNKGKKVFPITCGVNIEDWWGKPLPLKKAFIGWHGKTLGGNDIYAYFYPWNNPYPEEKILSIELECYKGESSLALIAVTGRIEEKLVVDRKKILKLENLLDKKEREIREIEKSFKNIYKKIMVKRDVLRALKSLETSSLKEEINIYRKFLKMMLY